MTNKSKALVALAVVVSSGLAWLVWRRLAGAGEEDAAAPTEVAVRVAALKRATLRAYVTAYGVIEPEPIRPDAPPTPSFSTRGEYISRLHPRPQAHMSAHAPARRPGPKTGPPST